MAKKAQSQALHLVELAGGPHDGHKLEVAADVKEIVMPSFFVWQEGHPTPGGFRRYRRTRKHLESGRIAFDLVPRAQ